MDSPSFTKEPDGSRVADFGAGLTALEIEMEFEQRTGGGRMGRLIGRLNPADPDLVCGVGAGNLLTDLIDAKDKQRDKSGAVVHRGDAKGSGSEVIAIDLTQLLAYDSDLDAFVLGAFCKGEQGFGRIAGVVWRVYDTSTGQRQHLGNVRIDISSTDSAVAAATLKRTGNGNWQCRIAPKFGRSTSVAGLGNLFRTALGGV